MGDERFLLEEVGGWVGFVFTLVSGWVGDGKIEEDEAVRMSYCELGVGGWVGEVGWVGRWVDGWVGLP